MRMHLVGGAAGVLFTLLGATSLAAPLEPITTSAPSPPRRDQSRHWPAQWKPSRSAAPETVGNSVAFPSW